jgi:hypothetical protein
MATLKVALSPYLRHHLNSAFFAQDCRSDVQASLTGERDLCQGQLDQVQATNATLRAERTALEQQLTEAKWSVWMRSMQVNHIYCK